MWPLLGVMAGIALAGAGVALRGAESGTLLAVLGMTLINFVGIYRGRAGWQDIADTYYDRGYHDGRRIGRPVVVPIRRCEACPLGRRDGTHTATRPRTVSG